MEFILGISVYNTSLLLNEDFVGKYDFDGLYSYYFFFEGQTLSYATVTNGQFSSSEVALEESVSYIGNINFVTVFENGNILVSYMDKENNAKNMLHTDVFSSDGTMIESNNLNYGAKYLGIGQYGLENGNEIILSTFKSDDQTNIGSFSIIDAQGKSTVLNEKFTTDDSQQTIASIADFGDGNFGVVSFMFKLGESSTGISLQRYNEEGTATGDQIVLYNSAVNWMYDVESFNHNQNFAVLFSQFNASSPDGLDHLLYEYDSFGNLTYKYEMKVQNNFNFPSSDVIDQKIINLTNGNFVLAWGEDNGWDYPNIYGYYFQLFDKHGVPIGNVVDADLISTSAYDDSYDMNVTPLANGQFLFTWYQYGLSYTQGPMQRVFDADGNALTEAAGALDREQTSTIIQTVALPDGGWRYEFADGSIKTFHVTDVDNAPVAFDVNGADFEDDTRRFYKQDFWYHDQDGDAVTKIVITELPGLGTFTFRNKPVYVNEEINIEDVYNLKWTPSKNVFGDDYTSFKFRVITSGTSALSNEAEFSISVIPIPDPPTSTTSPMVGKEDTTFHFSENLFHISDPDTDTGFLISLSTPSGHGAFYFGKNQVAFPDIAVTDLHKLSFVPVADFFGKVEIDYQINDPKGPISKPYHTNLIIEEVRDTIRGSKFANEFHQHRGSFLVFGLAGDDVFRTGSFNDTFVGGRGRDRFVMTKGSGLDAVRDFDHSDKNHDFIDVRALHLNESFSDFLHDHVTEKNDSAIISFTDGVTTSSLTLQHTDIDQLKADFFMF